MVTIDTNIVFYALERADLADNAKADRAKAALAQVDFLSIQVLNEYAFAARRKLRREWAEIRYDLDLLRDAVPDIHGIEPAANREALRIAERYQLAYFDALMIAIALANGAVTLYSEDIQHGLVIDGQLTIANPFLTTDPA